MRRIKIECLLALAVTACNAQEPSQGLGEVFAPQPAVRAAAHPETYLYVANSPAKGPGSIAEFVVKNATVAKRIKIQTGISKPMAISLDSSGNLYVANANFSTDAPGWVNVYAPGSTAVLRRISSPVGRFPYALAFDTSGDLYVANYPYTTSGGSIDVYPPESATETRSITQAVTWPTALAVNRDGSLYVGNTYAINLPSSTTSEYARSATTPELTFGSAAPKAIAVDRSNDVYLASNEPGPRGLIVAVFAPNSSKLVRSIPASYPNAITFDRHGNLYVANTGGSGSVAVYASESKTLLRTITAGISGPTSLAFDSAGNLYVANQGKNSVTVYAAGKTTVLQKITRGINAPIALAVGSR